MPSFYFKRYFLLLYQNQLVILNLLALTLDIFNVLPATSFSTPEEMQQAFGGVQTLIIDATERAVQRPSDYEEQNEFYSGKKNSIQLKIPL